MLFRRRRDLFSARGMGYSARHHLLGTLAQLLGDAAVLVRRTGHARCRLFDLFHRRHDLGQSARGALRHRLDAADLCLTDGAYFLQARLNVSLPGLEREAAQALTDAAHQACPYSKAIRGNVDVVFALV